MFNKILNFIKALFSKNSIDRCANQSCSPVNESTQIENPLKHPLIKLRTIRNADSFQADLTQKAVELCNRIYATEYFKNKILLSQCTETNNLNSQAIYNFISQNITEVTVEWFMGNFRQNHWYHTMGYDIGDGTTYVNSYFVKDIVTLGSLITHEALGHGKGFTHYQNKQTSFPYYLNEAFESTAAHLGIK